MADKCNSVTGAIPKFNSTSLEESKFLMVILIEIATLSFHQLPLVFGYGCWFHESFHSLFPPLLTSVRTLCMSLLDRRRKRELITAEMEVSDSKLKPTGRSHT
ncbi:hypothetical protein OIU77_018967 [Salix suchowensis]|uniref:Uncharacterized protein n=1 Tax=Salix suchowensis TaxID=1278906 RepID=A0ABQ9CEK8_9ROSI|nr:hypothetical protein OIU77_018967 [Salix suchowensis]